MKRDAADRMAAPVLPAVTSASAAPSATRSVATSKEDLGLAATAARGLSVISTTSGA